MAPYFSPEVEVSSARPGLYPITYLLDSAKDRIEPKLEIRQ